MTDERPSALARLGASMLRLRWFVRAPILLFRARLGFLFGHRFLLLEHRGRTSGVRRYAMLEVVEHPAPNRWVVVSGFGERAQWYRNVMADPNVRIYLGSRAPRPATALRLDPDTAAASLRRYAAAHPRAWAKMRPVLEQTLGQPIGPGAATLPLVAFDVAGARRSL